MIPRIPAKSLNAGLFFFAFPVVAYFLLHGGGLSGFATSWSSDLLSGFTGSIAEAGNELIAAGHAAGTIGPLLVVPGKFVVWLGAALSMHPPRTPQQRVEAVGDPPSPTNPPSGCRFRTRCPFAFERCTTEEPPLRSVSPGHRSACHLIEAGTGGSSPQ